jgi:predicted MPP superfamily phosphohydrolase
MKTIIIGDIHGRDLWKRIVDVEADADRIVFLGDYFDSFDIPGVVQLQNFLDIIDFKKNSNKEVVLLFGNHDYHYMPGFIGMGYSGYQTGLAYQFREAISANLEHLQMAHLFDNVLCSHAGISPEWLEISFGKPKDESEHNWSTDTLDDVRDVVELINEHFKFKPSIFEFNGWDPHGDNTYQTPIWIRPASLMASNKKNTSLKKHVIQVVGHTQVKNIFESVKATEKSMGGKYYLNDAIASNGYLTVENNKFKPKEIKI